MAVVRRDVVARGLRPVGAAGARHPGGDHPRRPLERGVPVPHGARDHRGPGSAARAACDLRRRARLGAVRARRVRHRPVGHAVGGGSPARPGGGRLSRDRRPAPGEGVPRLGERTSRPTTPRSRPASGSPCAWTRATSWAAMRSLVAQAAGPREAPAVPRARRPARGSASATSRCGSTGAVVGRVTSGGYGFSVGRASPTPTCRPRCGIGARGEVEVFGTAVGFEVAREPLFDPAGARIRA